MWLLVSCGDPDQFSERRKTFTHRGLQPLLWQPGVLVSCLANSHCRRVAGWRQRQQNGGLGETHNQLDLVSGPLTHGPLCPSPQLPWLPAPHTPADPNFTHDKCEEHSRVFTTRYSVQFYTGLSAGVCSLLTVEPLLNVRKLPLTLAYSSCVCVSILQTIKEWRLASALLYLAL